MKLAVIGGGWAGIAAAVRAVQAGHEVALIEMAPRLGGRARSLDDGLDCGQHILIGAYRKSLALMRLVGVDPAQALLRLPLQLRGPRGDGLQLPAGPAVPAFVRGVLAHRGWPLGTRLALLARAGRWMAAGFRCDPALSVAVLCQGLPAVLLTQLVEPLCVAALNTPMAEASATVFLRVLKDALFAGPGGADLLLPRVPLAELLARPAEIWLREHGARVETGRRLASLDELAAFDRVVVATSSVEAARLVEPLDAGWSQTARRLRFEPICTVYVDAPGARLPAPMTMLTEGPAQFVFGHQPGLLAFSISAAAPWVERGLDATGDAVLAQARSQLCIADARVRRVLAEKRATFACTPGLQRPPARIDSRIAVAGDYVEGPYPATLEGAVLSGLAAVA
ncbi:FAD-dependent oxidoreductase [Paucibacter sp. R3-3]|uniref:FAD-dependent oxidoreductase n=1 Tax=Roseateles agri TaxID=3098619 RepID=A0ABU5DL49_9BURK|nr:FAD-dependent oxidoreductase [Paucibacter sp. R3-3]MDY0747037.1 FAD-dependent oxidoreductase [Paucibacter sp. R3-3]